MKKLLMLSLLGALSLVAQPIGECRAETPAVPAASAALPTGHLDLAKELLASFDDMTSIIRSAKDKESADAAAAQLVPVIDRIKEIVAAVEALDAPSPELLAQLEELEPQLTEKMGALMEALMPLIMVEFYGSQSLMEVLQTMQ